MDWTEIGALPPMVMFPTCICRVFLRISYMTPLNYSLVKDVTDVADGDDDHQRQQNRHANKVDNAFTLRF